MSSPAALGRPTRPLADLVGLERGPIYRLQFALASAALTHKQLNLVTAKNTHCHDAPTDDALTKIEGNRDSSPQRTLVSSIFRAIGPTEIGECSQASGMSE
jgi:hypothetical protein